MKTDKLVRSGVIITFVTLYLLVSLISTIHVIDFFELSNNRALAITLAIAFEVGAAASLASLVILDKMNKTLVWALFITITLMQMQGNMFYAFKNLEGFAMWSELFDLIDEDVLFQKRVLSAVSGAILPLVALGFIKSLVDYIKPESNEAVTIKEISEKSESIIEQEPVMTSEEIEWSNEIAEEEYLNDKYDDDYDYDDGPPWYTDDEEEDLLDIATRENEKKKRDSYLEDENPEDDK
tara:strand:+ start:2222 stop:2935 length:714 start_codon:yes stop_codon:yes gene_type:complete